MRNLIGGLSRLPQVTKDVIRVNVHPKSTAEHCERTPGHNNSDVQQTIIRTIFSGEKKLSDLESVSFRNFLKILM
jgi:hypothetical protein